MNLPPTWEVNSRSQSEGKQPNKKARYSTRTKQLTTAQEESLAEDSSVLETIKNTVSNSRTLQLPDDSVNLDSILSNIPYKKIIEDVYENYPTQVAGIPLVTRAYEESFMRECEGDKERQCIKMQDCECMKIDKGNRFIGTQFLLPTDTPDDTPRMCVLCMRQETQHMFFDMMYDGKTFRFPIQKYGNICNQPNEYAREAMLLCPVNGPVHAMPYPIVAHQRNRYAVCNNYGTRYLKQLRVGVEDYAATNDEVSAPHPSLHQTAR
eukprot:1894388-Rhodomonas_salina.2